MFTSSAPLRRPHSASPRPYSTRFGFRKAESETNSLFLNTPASVANNRDYGTTAESIEHCHRNQQSRATIDKKARRKLIVASVLCLFFMMGEIFGGAIAGSLAIMTDAAHLLTDFASFMISLFAIFLASLPATKKMSFGWYRAEVVGALVSVLMIWVITGILVYLAVMRVTSGDYEINAEAMLITSAIGVVVNIIMAGTLHQHAHSHASGTVQTQPVDRPHPVLEPSSVDETRPITESFRDDVSSRDSIDEEHHGHGHSHNSTVSRMEEGGAPRRTSQPFLTVETRPEATSSHGHSHSHSHSHGHSPSASPHSHSHHAGGAGAENPSHGHSHEENLNVRAAFIHVIGDFLQSLGVLTAAFIIYFKPEYKIADPICTFVFSLLVLFTTITILRDTMHVLMEGAPKGMDFNVVKRALYEVNGVVEVHNLRLWSLTTTKTAVSVHLAYDVAYNSQVILTQASRKLRHMFQVHDVTIQMEPYIPQMAECDDCRDPRD